MEPLQEPARQIRLLRLIPAAVDDKISCEMTVHGFDRSTPEYLAISYTWGDTAHPREIFIDNELRMVRQNCHYALWQARYHYPGAYIWIDAVCIDQENLEEKSRQVSMMSKIFARASEVLACVGPDHDDSDFLWNFSQEFTYQALRPTQREAFTWVNIISYSRAGISCEQLWDHWAASNSVEVLERFLNACDKFTNRPYWERLWILQEVGLAGGKKVLCGRFCLSWAVTSNLLLLQRLKKAQTLFKFSCNAFYVVSDFSITQAMDESLMTQFRLFKCEDARDRIFGTRVFLRFHDRKFHIEPDYGKCALELAMTIMRHSMPWIYTHDLLCLLEINMNCPEFQALVVQRSHQQASMISEVPSHYNMALTATRLRRDGKGRLTCSLERHDLSQKDLAMLNFVKSACNDRVLDEMLFECAKVYAGEEIVVFLGKETREGDYLVEFDWDTSLYLVLRHCTETVFDIVSHGFSLESHAICTGGRGKCGCAELGIAHDTLLQTSFYTSLSVEDVVVFVGQDLLCDKDAKSWHDPMARLRRLITPVSSHPGPIAIMKDYDCGNDSDGEDDPYDGGDEENSDGASETDDSLESDNGTDAKQLRESSST